MVTTARLAAHKVFGDRGGLDGSDFGLVLLFSKNDVPLSPIDANDSKILPGTVRR